MPVGQDRYRGGVRLVLAPAVSVSQLRLTLQKTKIRKKLKFTSAQVLPAKAEQVAGADLY